MRIRLPAAAWLLFIALGAGAQDAVWPTRPVRIVVPTAPGVAPDIFARLYAEPLAKALATPVTVENRPGAAAIIALDAVLKSPADGHTVLYAFNAPFTMNPHLYAKLPYDAEADFQPLMQNLKGAYFVVTGPEAPHKSLRDFFDQARAAPGRLAFASYGTGSAAHLAMAMIEDASGIRLNHVPYKASALPDVISGTVAVTTEPNGSIIPLIQSGRVRALAYTGAVRHPLQPQVPTVSEAIPGYEVLGWHGLWVRAGTPRAASSRLHAELLRITQGADMRKRMADVGFEPGALSAEETAAIIRRESAMWGKLIKARGIRLD